MPTRIPYISYRPGAVFDDRKRFTERLPIRVDEDDCCALYDPVAIHFPPQNVAVGYDLTNAGIVSARTYDITLGTGGVTYAPYAEDRSAIYNMHDDRMYFLATRTVAMVDTPVMVRFDPRAGVVEAYATIPGGGTTANSTLVDVSDERLWISHDDVLYCYDTITLTEVFNDGGDFAVVSGGDINSFHACRSGQIVGPTDGDPTTVHLFTVTGPTTYMDMPIAVLDGGGGNNVSFANNGSHRRRYIGDRNKLLLPYIAVPDGGIMFALIDLNDLSVLTTYSPAGASYDISGPGPYWDHYGQRMTGSMTDAVGSDYGIFVGSDTGVTVGFPAFNSAALWSSGQRQPLGGTVISASQTIEALAGFSETTISNTPSEIFQTSDAYTSPLSNFFDYEYMCVAPRRSVLGPLVTV